MKRKTIILITLVTIMLLSSSKMIKSNGQEGDPFVEPIQMRCTCYINQGITASGQHTRPFIMAGRREWLGCVAIVYRINEDGTIGDFLGYYEILDTGAGIDTDGDGIGDSIKNGKSVDVWLPNMDAVRQWQKANGDYVYIKLVRGVG